VIDAVSKIGKYIQSSGDDNGLLSTFIQNPNVDDRYPLALVVVLHEVDGSYTFSHVELEEVNNFQKYLYKKGTDAGTDITPTCKVAGKLERTVEKKFFKWFQNYETYDLTPTEKEILQKMNLELQSKKDQILDELQKKYSNKKPKENAIITLAIERDGKKNYMASFPVLSKILLQKGKDRYFIRKTGESLGRDVICCICQEEKEEVFGFAIPWTFHTFDKPSFIAGGFELSESWKNTPVCFNCATDLEAGKKYIEENLDFDFYGIKYLLIPKLTFGGDYSQILKRLSANSQRKMRITRDVNSDLDLSEYKILRIMGHENFFSNSLLFYKPDKAAFRILLLIEGILPSRVRILYEAKKTVDEDIKRYYVSQSMTFDFGVLRTFFPSRSDNGSYNHLFLEMVNKIFVGKLINYQLLIKSIMRQIRMVFAKREPTNETTLHGFMLLNYLKELNLLEVYMNKTNTNEKELINIIEYKASPLEEKITKFFESNNAFFNTDAKKATFLEGMLTQYLLNIQLEERDATPFLTKLHGLKLDEHLIKKLLREIQIKLEEYNRNIYQDLEYLISKHFVLASENWGMNIDETSFYFVLGMNMSRLFEA
jgi:CRISPR-associated protein Csh1